MMGKTSRCRFNNFFPARRFVSLAKRECEDKGRILSVEILAGHPYPGKCPAAAKRNLTFTYPQFSRADGLYRLLHGLEYLFRRLLSGEKLLQCRHGVLSRADLWVGQPLKIHPGYFTRALVPDISQMMDVAKMNTDFAFYQLLSRQPQAGERPHGADEHGIFT